jgi:serine/threonine protein kinase
MKKKVKNTDNHLQEYKTWKRISFHPNIVQLYDTFLEPTTKEFYFIMEYMNGGNLYQFINQRKESNVCIKSTEIKSILYQILSALSHIHTVEGIFHRDMKPENLLIAAYNSEITIKLADFGLAADIKKKKTPNTDYVSTRWYRAPEVLLKSSNYSAPIDLWAVGTIFAELVTLRPLFPGQSEIDQLFRICQVLGSPSCSQQQQQQKKRPTFITSKSSAASVTVIIPPPSTASQQQQHLESSGNIGGEWKEGLKLAHKMGFEFPKVDFNYAKLKLYTLLSPPLLDIIQDINIISSFRAQFYIQ